jgi:hypothetical protein
MPAREERTNVMGNEVDRHTPAIVSVDPRGLAVVSVSYHRREVGAEPEARVERQSYDAAGRLGGQWDARLWAGGGLEGEPNQRTVSSLSGQALRTDKLWRSGIVSFGVLAYISNINSPHMKSFSNCSRPRIGCRCAYRFNIASAYIMFHCLCRQIIAYAF